VSSIAVSGGTWSWHRGMTDGQFARAERLHDIVVGAAVEPANAVALLTACGQHDDR
jgi:hypothetical protein